MTDPLDQAERWTALLEKGPLALVAVLCIAGFAWVLRFHFRAEQRHRDELRALGEGHRKDLAAINEARLLLAAEFEGTVRELLFVVKKTKRAMTARIDPPKPKLVPGEGHE